MPGLAIFYLSLVQGAGIQAGSGPASSQRKHPQAKLGEPRLGQGCRQTLMSWLRPRQVPWLVECYGSAVASAHWPKAR